MGVIKRYGVFSLLNIASVVQDPDILPDEEDADSEGEADPVAPRLLAQKSARPRAPLASQPTSMIIRHAPGGHRGKRSRRRIGNELSLLDVCEKEGDEGVEDVDDYRPSALSSLFLDEECMQAWRAYTEMSEEAQEELLLPRHRRGSDSDSSDSFVEVVQEDLREVHPALSPVACFQRITGAAKEALRHRVPLGLLLYLECRVRESVAAAPGAVHVQRLGPFERLLLHAVCQYLGLACCSFDGEDGERVTEVEDAVGSFSPPNLTLAHYLEMRSTS